MTWDPYIDNQKALADALHPPIASPFEAVGLIATKNQALINHLHGSGDRGSRNKRIEQAQTLVHIMVIAARTLQSQYADINPVEITNYFKP